MVNLHVLFELWHCDNVEAPKTIEISSLAKKPFGTIFSWQKNLKGVGIKIVIYDFLKNEL
jgi:hypothetical protein